VLDAVEYYCEHDAYLWRIRRRLIAEYEAAHP